MNFTLLSIYLMSIILIIATPGPVVAFVLNSSARGGFKHALLSIIGTNWASLVLIATATLMIMGIITVNHSLLSWISLAGCVFLAWIAIDGLRSELRKNDNTGVDSTYTEISSKSVGVKRILHGFLVGISNPKDIIFFIAFFPQFINITSHVKISLSVLAVLWIICDFLILLSYALIMKTKRFQQHHKWISILSSGFLLAVAVGASVYTSINLLK